MIVVVLLLLMSWLWFISDTLTHTPRTKGRGWKHGEENDTQAQPPEWHFGRMP